MMSLTVDQQKAIEHLDQEQMRYKRMAQRLRDIKMPVLATACEHVSAHLKQAMELQLRILRHPQAFLKFEPYVESDPKNPA